MEILKACADGRYETCTWFDQSACGNLDPYQINIILSSVDKYNNVVETHKKGCEIVRSALHTVLYQQFFNNMS